MVQPIRNPAPKMRHLSAIFVVLLICLASTSSVLAQQLSLTFDDLKDPAAADQAGVSASIRRTLALHGLRSTLFVCGMRVDTASGIHELHQWRKGGHEIANHSYSHANFSRKSVTIEDFVADVRKNHDFLIGNGLRPLRFRFPYLKEGDTRDKRDGMRAWLTDNGYRSGAVTIDASDWYYDQRYRAWREKYPDADDGAFRQAYLEHLWDRARYYDGLSRKHVGRSVRHTLLLHVNHINARFLPDIITMFRDKGWQLIDTRSAYRDRVYRLSPDVVPAGESILWQIAKQAGDTDLRSPGEDGRYEQPILDRLGL